MRAKPSEVVRRARKDVREDRLWKAFHERFGNSGVADQFSQIPARDPLDAYPAVARRDLAELRERAGATTPDWPREGRVASAEGYSRSGRFDWLPGAVILLMFVGPWLIGAGSLIYAIASSVL